MWVTSFKLKLHYNPTSFASILPKLHKPSILPKLVRELAKAYASRKIVLKNLPAIKKIKIVVTCAARKERK